MCKQLWRREERSVGLSQVTGSRSQRVTSHRRQFVCSEKSLAIEDFSSQSGISNLMLQRQSGVRLYYLEDGTNTEKQITGRVLGSAGDGTLLQSGCTKRRRKWVDLRLPREIKTRNRKTNISMVETCIKIARKTLKVSQEILVCLYIQLLCSEGSPEKSLVPCSLLLMGGRSIYAASQHLVLKAAYPQWLLGVYLLPQHCSALPN